MGIILGIVLGFINLLGSLSVDQKGWPRWLTTKYLGFNWIRYW